MTVGTNNDKTGYSLTQAFPTNFSSLAITATTGEVTVGTNLDKVGYSLATDPMSVTVPGSYAAGSAGYVLGTNLNATVSSRMASGNVTVGGYAAGEDPASLLLITPTDKLATDASGRVTVGSNADKTGYSISGTKTTLDVLNDFNPNAAMTESYAAKGSPMTMEQAFYTILSALTNFSISGTTITCTKLDVTTTSMTFTLNDPTNPTSRTRTT